MFHGEIEQYREVELGSEVAVWAWSRVVGGEGFKEGAALTVVQTKD